MRKQTSSGEDALLKGCFLALTSLQTKEIFSTEQQALFDKVVDMEDPKEWREDEFDFAVYKTLLEQLRLMESSRDKVYTLKNRLEQLKPSMAPSSFLFI